MGTLDELKSERTRVKKNKKAGERLGARLSDWAGEKGKNYNKVAWKEVDEAHKDLSDLI